MKIAVIGISCTKFKEHWDKSLQDLLAQAQLEAIKDAKIFPQQIEAIFTGNMCSGIFSGQLHLGSMAAENLSLNTPSTVIEGACASGGLALRAGILAIQSGLHNVVMVNGVEKMTDLDTEQITTGLMAAANEEYEHSVGATFAGLNALIAKRYMYEFGLTREQLAAVSIKNHKNGALNPLAHFQKEICIKNILTSTIIADPLTIFDCAPISDGAASIILSTPEFAKKLLEKRPDQKIVYIIGSAQASDTLALNCREKLTEFKANKIAAQIAYEMSNITPQQIDLAEIHDGFSITEIISLEDLGFFETGTAGKATENGETSLNSKISINPSGGLKAKGHPVGATGISQAYEVVIQLRGQAGERQVKNAKVGLTHNMGGCGTTSVVHIFSKE